MCVASVTNKQTNNQSVPNIIELIFPGLPPEKADGVFEVPDAEAQESYIFNKFGQHVITKDLMTGTTKFKMSYTQTTSTGKEVKIRDEVLTEFKLCSLT